jgi:biopolymer transport protein ExbD
MQIEFVCGVCRHALTARPEQVGSQAICPRCRASLSVPDPSESSAYASSGRWQVAELVAEETPIHFRRHAASESELDLTPMVDVTFLLLIFFMVTAAFSLQKSFEVPPPRDEAASTVEAANDDAQTVVVRVDEYNTYHVSAAIWNEEKEAPSEQDLLFRLREAKLGSGVGGSAKRLVVMAHDEAVFDRVVKAMDAGNIVGMEEVLLRRDDDEG